MPSDVLQAPARAPAPVMPVKVPGAARAPAAPRPGLTPKARNRIAAGGAAATLAFTTLSVHEGYSSKAYIPIKGDVPTICFGETRNVRMGMSMTRAQCEAQFIARLAEFADGIESCVTRPMWDDVYVAFLSLAYNVGIGSPKHPGFCQSTAVRLYNAGDRRAACRAIANFNKAGGRVVQCLVNRRAEEVALCLKGI